MKLVLNITFMLILITMMASNARKTDLLILQIENLTGRLEEAILKLKEIEEKVGNING